MPRFPRHLCSHRLFSLSNSIVPPLDVNNWELSGVDFHVSNIGMQLEQKRGLCQRDLFCRRPRPRRPRRLSSYNPPFPAIWVEVLELAGSTNSAIWTASSGRNEKPVLPFVEEEPPSETTAALIDLWDSKVKPTFDSIAMRILASRCRQAHG
jgi:hypothetical protein